MANSKANVKKSQVDYLKDLKSQQNKQFGLQRQNFSGIGTAQSIPMGASGKTGQGSNASIDEFLKKQGDTMVGPIAFGPVIQSIISDAITVAEGTEFYTSMIVITAETGSIDNLQTINGVKFQGQWLLIQANNASTITIKHAVNNIHIPTGIDYVLAPKEIIAFVYDVLNLKWSAVATFSSGSGAGTTEFIDTAFRIKDNVDNTKKFGFEASGITTGITRIYTVPNQDGTLPLLERNQTFTGDNTFTGLSFLVSSTSITLGDAGTDTININAKLGTNFDMNQFDILNADEIESDMLKFINQNAAIITGWNIRRDTNDDMGFNVPDTRNFVFRINGVNKLGILGTTIDINGNFLNNVLEMVSSAANPAAAGSFIRMSNNQKISSRNQGNTADKYLKLNITNEWEVDAPFIPSANITHDIGAPTLAWDDIYGNRLRFIGDSGFTDGVSQIATESGGDMVFKIDNLQTFKWRFNEVDGNQLKLIPTGGGVNAVLELKASNIFKLLGASTEATIANLSNVMTFTAEGDFEFNNSSGTTPQIAFISQNSGDELLVSNFKFFGRDSGAAQQEYAAIKVRIKDPTSTSEDGGLEFRLTEAGITDIAYITLDASTGFVNIFKPIDIQSQYIIMGERAAPVTVSNAVSIYAKEDTDTITKMYVKQSDGTEVKIGEATTSFVDSTFEVKDNTDNTKIFKVEVSNVATGTTRTLKIPNRNGQIIVKDDTSGFVEFESVRGANCANPVNAQDVATKNYVDSQVQAEIDDNFPKTEPVFTANTSSNAGIPSADITPSIAISVVGS